MLGWGGARLNTVNAQWIEVNIENVKAAVSIKREYSQEMSAEILSQGLKLWVIVVHKHYPAQ